MIYQFPHVNIVAGKMYPIFHIDNKMYYENVRSNVYHSNYFSSAKNFESIELYWMVAVTMIRTHFYSINQPIGSSNVIILNVYKIAVNLEVWSLNLGAKKKTISSNNYG